MVNTDLSVMFGLGMLLGFVSSMPIGPINITFFASQTCGRVREGLALALAVVLLDGLYAFAALSATSADHFPLSLALPIKRLAYLFLIGYGISFVFPRSLTPKETSLSRRIRGTLAGATLGAALYLLNPALAAFWLSTAFILRTRLPQIAFLAGRFGFALGVSIGVGLWFALLHAVIRRYSFPWSFVHWATRGIGIFLIVLGAYLMAKHL